MFRVEIDPERAGNGWVATVSYTLKSELVDYQPAKVHMIRIVSLNLMKLMDVVLHYAVSHLAP